MKTKTSELIGPALDWAVATLVGYSNLRMNPHKFAAFLIMTPPREEYGPVQLADLDYSSSWAQGGPIIEREEIGIKRRAPCMPNERWEASGSITAKGAGYWFAVGPTPLVAAMRCFVVASRLGDEIDVPEELL